MTPAIDQLTAAGINFKIHHYTHKPGASYGLEAAEALRVSPQRVYKTLLVSLNSQAKNLAVAVVPVDKQLDLKATAKVLQAKKVELADPKLAQRVTGYLVGGISPLGQKQRLPTLIDEQAKQFEQVLVSAGKRGLEIELAAQALADLLDARFAALGKG